MKPQPETSPSQAMEQRAARESDFNISAKPTGAELIKVVEFQLNAFRNDDYPKAYEMAADELRSQISVTNFERMVRTRYPLIAKSTGVKFGVIVDNGDEAIVNLTVTGENGRVSDYQYFLQKQKRGWRIGGVMELRPSKDMI